MMFAVRALLVPVLIVAFVAGMIYTVAMVGFVEGANAMMEDYDE